MIWLESRKFENKDALREVQSFVIIDNLLEEEYDAFRSNISDGFYIPENDLLHHWYYNIEQEDPHDVHKYGKIYFKMTQKKLDKFYTWLKNTKALASGVHTSTEWVLVYACIHECYHLNYCIADLKQ